MKMAVSNLADDIKFIDIGSNLTDLMFQGVYNGRRHHNPDLNRVIERAKNGGLEKIIITSGNYEECVQSLKICQEYDPEHNFLFTTVGVHPTRTREFLCDSCRDIENVELDCSKCDEHSKYYMHKLKELIKKNAKRIVAIGEFGLDSERTQFSNMSIQEKYFELQFELLKEQNLPMFLHMRTSFSTQENKGEHNNNSCFLKFTEILNKYKYLWERKKGVVHSFTGSVNELNVILDMGLDIGINGCSLKSDENLSVVSRIPVDRLHIETGLIDLNSKFIDSPWCDIKKTHSSYSYIDTHFPEVSKPAKWLENMLVRARNEPVKIIQVAQILHKNLNCNLSFNEFSLQVYNNTKRMYFNI